MKGKTHPILSRDERDDLLAKTKFTSAGWKWRISQDYRKFLDAKLERGMFWATDLKGNPVEMPAKRTTRSRDEVEEYTSEKVNYYRARSRIWFVIDPDASTDVETAIEEFIKDGRKVKYLHTLKLKVEISEEKSFDLSIFIL